MDCISYNWINYISQHRHIAIRLLLVYIICYHVSIVLGSLIPLLIPLYLLVAVWVISCITHTKVVIRHSWQSTTNSIELGNSPNPVAGSLATPSIKHTSFIGRNIWQYWEHPKPHCIISRTDADDKCLTEADAWCVTLPEIKLYPTRDESVAQPRLNM